MELSYQLELSEEQQEAIRVQYGVDQPVYVRYIRWIENVLLRGNLGRSYVRQLDNVELIAQALPWTLGIALVSLLVSYGLAIPLGIYSATHQYKFSDYILTFIGFFGLGSPGFLLAMGAAYITMKWFDFVPIGLYSSEYLAAPWSWAKFVDLLKHLWLPLLLLILTGIAGTMRTVRNNLLDQLHQQYVVTARAKGLPERRVVMKYPVRLAINPVVGYIGFVFGGILSSGGLVAVVLGLPTIFPLLLSALRTQDYNLAATLLMIIATMTLIGGVIADVLLAMLDPRIRYEGGAR
jgi:peptide/nickel transport system permease protein